MLLRISLTKFWLEKKTLTIIMLFSWVWKNDLPNTKSHNIFLSFNLVISRCPMELFCAVFLFYSGHTKEEALLRSQSGKWRLFSYAHMASVFLSVAYTADFSLCWSEYFLIPLESCIDFPRSYGYACTVELPAKSIFHFFDNASRLLDTTRYCD